MENNTNSDCLKLIYIITNELIFIHNSLIGLKQELFDKKNNYNGFIKRFDELINLIEKYINELNNSKEKPIYDYFIYIRFIYSYLININEC